MGFCFYNPNKRTLCVNLMQQRAASGGRRDARKGPSVCGLRHLEYPCARPVRRFVCAEIELIISIQLIYLLLHTLPTAQSSYPFRPCRTAAVCLPLLLISSSEDLYVGYTESVLILSVCSFYFDDI